MEHLSACCTAHSWLSLCKLAETGLSVALGVHVPTNKDVCAASTSAFKIINNFKYAGLLLLSFIFILSDCKMGIKHFASYFADHVSILLVR